MITKEYVETIERLMDLQNNYIGWMLAILGLLIALAAFYQWRLSKGDKETLRKEMDNKTAELKRETEIKLSELEKKSEKELSELKNQLSVKSGNNANGNWVRYPNGDQICRHTIPIDRERFQGDISWVYPAAFYDSDMVIFTEVEDTDKVAIKKIIKEKHQLIILLERLSSFTETGDSRINLIAYGRWKKEEQN